MSNQPVSHRKGGKTLLRYDSVFYRRLIARTIVVCDHIHATERVRLNRKISNRGKTLLGQIRGFIAVDRNTRSYKEYEWIFISNYKMKLSVCRLNNHSLHTIRVLSFALFFLRDFCNAMVHLFTLFFLSQYASWACVTKYSLRKISSVR